MRTNPWAPARAGRRASTLALPDGPAGTTAAVPPVVIETAATARDRSSANASGSLSGDAR